MQEELAVVARDQRGTRAARRLRRSGRIPAVLYGQGEPSVSLTVEADRLRAALRHGIKLVQLAGVVSQSALIRELQWDTFGQEVLHIDFVRVQADQRITVTVAIHVRGIAPGSKVGGIVEQLVHELEIEVRAAAIPESLHVNVNHLELSESLTAKQIEDLPEGAVLVSDPEDVIVQCTVPVEVLDEELPADGLIEPEVIGGKADQEDGDAE